MLWVLCEEISSYFRLSCSPQSWDRPSLALGTAQVLVLVPGHFGLAESGCECTRWKIQISTCVLFQSYLNLDRPTFLVATVFSPSFGTRSFRTRWDRRMLTCLGVRKSLVFDWCYSVTIDHFVSGHCRIPGLLFGSFWTSWNFIRYRSSFVPPSRCNVMKSPSHIPLCMAVFQVRSGWIKILGADHIFVHLALRLSVASFFEPLST